MILDEKATKGIVHFDDVSVGFYTFPFPLLEVSPHANSSTSVSQFSDEADVSANSSRFQLLDNRVYRGTSDIRILPDSTLTAILSWLKVTPSFALSTLIQALPGFWLNRARLARHFINLKDGVANEIDLSSFLASRRQQREQLAQHSVSLGRKVWALRYHRSNFRESLDACEKSKDGLAYNMIRAAAEFTASNDTTYSLFEELALTNAIIERIAFGEERPQSFHALYDSRHLLKEDLKVVLDSATWFEVFQMRRANATHAFGAVVHFDQASNTVSWFQRCDRRFFPEDAVLQRNASELRKMFDEFAGNVDSFLNKLSICLLSRFHPFDVVSMRQKNPNQAGDFELATVWTREIAFDEKYRNSEEGEVLLDPTGSLIVRQTGDGGLKLVPLADLVGAHGSYHK